jgi:hypothetical protein
MRTIVSFLVFDRADGNIKILELPWGASFLMGQFASKYNKKLGSNEDGVDFTITDMSDDNVEKYAVDANSAESTPFTADEKAILIEWLKGRLDGMPDLYCRRMVDIKPLLNGLDIDPFDDIIEETIEEPEPKSQIIITVPSMDTDKYKPFMENTSDDVLKNLRTLANSKEYDNHLSQEMTEQEYINMEVFKIRTQIEIEHRERGLPFCDRFVSKIKNDYSSLVDNIDIDIFEIATNLI